MAVLKYTLLRLATFFILFAACLMLRLGMVFALVVGLVGSWAVAYLFFNRLRLEAGEQLASRFGKRRYGASEHRDNAEEDALAEDFHQDDDGDQGRKSTDSEDRPTDQAR